MEKKKIIKKIGILLVGVVFGFSSLDAQAADRKLTEAEMIGKKYFEGSASFQNGGPSCISCHSVRNKSVATGGLLAKDLTDVYSRLNEGLTQWLAAPAFPAMAASYQNNPLTENERVKLTAFLKYTDEVKDVYKNVPNGQTPMVIAGVGGLFSILILIGIIWFKQKRKMVKQEIFDRQSKAWDAKH